MGISNATEPINFVTSQESCIRVSCVELYRHGCTSNAVVVVAVYFILSRPLNLSFQLI